MRIYIFLLVALAAAATPALGGEIPVFVVAGQSNAVGAGTGYTALSSNLKVVQPNVLYSGPQESAVSWASLSPPTQTAQMVWPWDPMGGFGPELMVGKTISDAWGGQLVAVTKYAVNGTNLYGNWNPHTSGSLYSSMRARVNDALAKLPLQRPGTTGKVAGFFWMQGESDAIDRRTTAQYQADLTNLIEHVRADFGDPNLPFIIGRITTPYGDGHSIRDAQAAVAANVPHTFMLNTDSYEQNPGRELGHYSTQGMVDLGIGFGNGYISSATTTVADGGIVEVGFGGAGSMTLGGLTFSGGGTVNINNIGNYTSGPAINVLSSNGLNPSSAAGAVTIALSGTAPSESGTAHILQYIGTLGGAGFNAFALNASAVSAPRVQFSLSDAVAGYVDVNYSVDRLVWSGGDGGNWITSGSITATGTTNWTSALSPSTFTNFVTGDAPVFSDSASGTTTVSINTANVSPASVAFTNITKAYTLQGAFGITGSASLTKSGSGLLTITNSNSYTGTTTINGGMLSAVSLADGGANSSIGASPSAAANLVINGGSLQYTGGSASSNRLFTINSGGATLDASGTGPLVLSNSGALAGSGLLTLSGTNTGSNALSAAISSTSSVTKAGPGTWVLSGSNTYSGTTTISGGVLQAGSATALGNNSGNITFGGGALQYTAASAGQDWSGRFKGSTTAPITLDTNSQSVTFASPIDNSNTAGLTKQGAGTLTLTNSQAYSGPTIITGGTLKLGAFSGVGSQSFNTSGTWTDPAGLTSVNYLVVGGGGGGGSSTGGGGGGGQVLQGTLSVTPGTSYPVAVGGAGAANGGNGGSSVFGSVTALGGGGGGTQGTTGNGGATVGSAGGGGGWRTGTANVDTMIPAATQTDNLKGYGGGNGHTNNNDKFLGGGGGGAGGLGGEASLSTNTAGAGGIGASSSITGALAWYGAGGGGAAFNNTSIKGTGGSGVGGNGAQPGLNATVGSANTGSGGGGAGSGTSAAAGGTGIVVLSWGYSSTGTLPSATALSIAAGSTLDLNGTAQTIASLSVTGTGVGGLGAVINSSATPATLTLTSGITLSANSSMAGTGAGNLTIAPGSGQPISLTYDGSTPALSISQGTLSLNNNPFTINGSSVLADGDYNIVTAASNITDGSTTYPIPTGTALTGKTAYITVSGTKVVLTVSGGAVTTVHHFEVTGIAATQTAGTAITGVTITAQDASNNTATDFTGKVVFSGTAGIAGTSAAFTAGQLTGVSVTPITAGSAKTFIVTGSTKTGTATFDVNPGAVSAANSTATASPATGVSTDGGATSTITVTAKDANNNVIAGAAVSASASGTNNTLATPANTSGSGQTTFTIASTKAETKTLTVTIAGTPITTQPTVAFVAGTAAAIALTSGNNQNGTVATALASPFVVTVTDANGNPKSGTSVTFAVATSPSGATGQTIPNATTDANGQGTSTLTLGSATGSYTVAATAAGLTGSPLTFTATAWPTGAVVKSATGTDLIAGASWTGGVAPVSTKIAYWMSRSLGSGLTLGTSGSWQGINVAGALSDIGITGAGTLTLGSSGIDMSVAGVNLSVGNPITLGATQTWTVDAARTLTMAGNLSSATTGVKTLTVNGAGNTQIGGNIGNGSGTLALTKSGAGTLTLSGTSNTYTDLTTVSGGTLVVSGGSGSRLGNAAALTVSGGALDLGTTSQTVGAVSITAPAASGDTLKNGDLTGTSYAASNTTGNAIVSANLLASGSAGFAMSGVDGTVTLAGANTYTGNTTVSGGTLTVGNNLAVQNSTVNTSSTGGAITFATGVTSPTFAGLSGSGPITLTTATSEPVALSVGSGSTDYSGKLSGTGGLIKNGTGTLVLGAAGGVTHDYSGPTTITGGGTLKLGVSVLGTPEIRSLTAGTWTAPDGVASTTVNYLVVGGGGGGGSNTGGGGGGGQVLQNTLPGISGQYTVVIGAGGLRKNGNLSAGNSGSLSSFGKTGGTTYTANGGGGGGSSTAGVGGAGYGSGGGGGGLTGGATPGAAGQGFAGGNGINTSPWNGGGGGGAAAVGGNASNGTIKAGGDGGAGVLFNGIYYGAGGGGGADARSSRGGYAGSVGAGVGGLVASGADAVAGTGSGGGGCSADGASGYGGAGGSGAVILSWNTSYNGYATLPSGTALSIAAGSTLDLSGSAQTIASLNVTGTGVGGLGSVINSSATAATLTLTSGITLSANSSMAGTGAGNLTIALGSGQPITLTYDGSTPALSISQGTLSLNNNPFTINGSSVLADGNYDIATATAITGTANPTPTGTALTGKTASITVSSTKVVLHVVSVYNAWLATNGNATASDAKFMTFAFGASAPGGASGSAGYVTGPPAVVTPGQPTTTLTTGNPVDFRAVFSRRSDYVTAGLSYTLQFSTDLNFGDGFRQDVPVTTANGGTIKLLGTGTVKGVSVDVMSVSYPLLIPVGAESKKPTFYRVKVNATNSSGQPPP